MPRLFRESPLNAIWEGSGTVIALDVLRTLQREPAARAAFEAETAPARTLDALAAAPPDEAAARILAERLALLLRHAPGPVAAGFVRARLGEERGSCYGALPPGVDVRAILRRQTDP